MQVLRMVSLFLARCKPHVRFFKHYKVHYKVLKSLNQTYMYNRTAMHNAESVTKTNSTKKDQ